MSAVQISTGTEFIQANTTTNPGFLLLPSTLMNAGRIITIKDITGSFGRNPLTLSTITGSFENGANIKRLTEPFGYLTLASDGISKWYNIDGTSLNTYTISNVRNNLGVSTATISTANLTVSTLGLVDNNYLQPSTMYVRSTLLYLGSNVIGGSKVGPTQFLRALTPPQFSPSQIPNLNFWLDAADTTTQTITSGFVAQWRDKGPNAYIFSNAATTGRTGPTRVTTQNGLNVLTFTSVSDNDANGKFLLNSSASMNANSTTIFIVNNPTTVNAGGTGTYWGNTSIVRIQPGATYIVFPYSWVGIPIGYITNQLTIPSVLVDNSVANQYNMIVANIASSRQSTWRNGSLNVSITSNFTAGTLTGCYIGCYQGNSEFYSGTLAEIVTYTVPLSLKQQQQVEGYLAWKWGLAPNLPQTHPYYYAPPVAYTS